MGSAIGTSYYRSRDRRRDRADGTERETENEIELIIEENGILHPVRIRKNLSATADETAAFTVLDAVPGKKRGEGALICLCPQHGRLRDKVLQIPAWFI